jgi:hypothetical protein
MNTKIILILFFATFSSCVNAQNSELLKGKWVFKDAYHKEKIDKAGLKSLKKDIINKMTFEFKNDGDFIAYAFGQNMNGKWSMKENSKTILLTTDEKEKFTFVILEITKTRLGLKMGLGEFLMTKRD